MQVKPTLVALAVVVAIGASVPAAAQGLSYGIKFGGGLAMTGTEAQDSRAMIGFALTGEWKFRQNDELFAEFAYRYFKADWIDRTRLGDIDPSYAPYEVRHAVGYAPGGVTGYIFNGDPNSYARGAVDMRKDALEGWGLNLGYRYKFPDTNLYAHGGLILNFMYHQQEIMGDIRVYDCLPRKIQTDPTPQQLYKEGLALTPAVHSIAPGAFAGLQWRMDRHFFSEFNVSWVSYSTIDYVPFAYTGKEAHTEDGSGNKLVVEFHIGFRF
jgi:opacity protein-like surface antigen